MIPRGPLVLGLVGLIPFVWGAMTVLVPDLGLWTIRTIGPRFAGPYVMLFYGTVILSFMSGVLWGFSSKLTGRTAALGYAVSVLPAIWAFCMTGGGPVWAGHSLMVGFIGILGLDWMFSRYHLTPQWWMQLRILLTSVVLVCLAIGVYL